MYRDSDWDNIHLADEGGIEARTRSLKRRTYNVKGPNHLWYIDLNHSLIRWYRIIFKVVDGFSLLFLYDALKITKQVQYYHAF